MEPNKIVNLLAEKFLREYLGKNPTVIPRLCHEHELDVGYSDDAAQKFILQLQTTEPDRIEIQEPEHLIILRQIKRGKAAYLAGFRRDGMAVWAYQSQFAQVMKRERADEVLKMLDGQEVFTMPAEQRGYSVTECLVVLGILLTLCLSLPMLLSVLESVRSLMSLVR